MTEPTMLLLTPPASGTQDPGAPLHALIEQQPFFKGLNSRQLETLSESALLMAFEPDQVLLQEGGPANRFYLILEGKVVFEMEADANGATIPIQTLVAGDAVGWSWLFPPYALHFSARALEPTKTIFFYGTRLREQCELDHEFGYQLMKRIAEVATLCLQATQQSFVTAGGAEPAESL
jgi:CRP/FNR family transcriptional regulator, cyclic AMP receptor protein